MQTVIFYSKRQSSESSSSDEVACYTQPHTMTPLHSITEADSPIKTNNSQPAKQILISYVRAEASEYALDLKSELENLNLSVYLVSGCDYRFTSGGSEWCFHLVKILDQCPSCRRYPAAAKCKPSVSLWVHRELIMQPLDMLVTVTPCILLAWDWRVQRWVHMLNSVTCTM